MNDCWSPSVCLFLSLAIASLHHTLLHHLRVHCSHYGKPAFSHAYFRDRLLAVRCLPLLHCSPSLAMFSIFILLDSGFRCFLLSHICCFLFYSCPIKVAQHLLPALCLLPHIVPKSLSLTNCYHMLVTDFASLILMHYFLLMFSQHIFMAGYSLPSFLSLLETFGSLYSLSFSSSLLQLCFFVAISSSPFPFLLQILFAISSLAILLSR